MAGRHQNFIILKKLKALALGRATSGSNRLYVTLEKLYAYIAKNIYVYRQTKLHSYMQWLYIYIEQLYIYLDSQ